MMKGKTHTTPLTHTHVHTTAFDGWLNSKHPHLDTRTRFYFSPIRNCCLSKKSLTDERQESLDSVETYFLFAYISSVEKNKTLKSLFFLNRTDQSIAWEKWKRRTEFVLRVNRLKLGDSGECRFFPLRHFIPSIHEDFYTGYFFVCWLSCCRRSSVRN